MLGKIKGADTFRRNIILVFAGTLLVNFFSLLYQLLVAHSLSASDFAAFNSLLSIFMIFSAPLMTFQLAVARYSAQFNIHNQAEKVKFLLSDLFRKSLFCGLITFFIFWALSFRIINTLKIDSPSCGYVLALLLGTAWFMPVPAGGTQGLELFGWFTAFLILGGVLKLAIGLLFIFLGFNISGALSAILFSSLVGTVILYFPLKRFISLKYAKQDINYKEIFVYLFPLAISSLMYMALVSLDLVLVKYFFLPYDSGIYALAQMVGKIFLFLPAAISVVMYPKTSGLSAANLDTAAVLKRSLKYAASLCMAAVLFYNVFPSFVLKVLTGKSFPESIVLGRLFSVSMSFFAILYILVTYFLSINDLRFIKYLVISAVLEFLAIVLFHGSLIEVQLILCVNAFLLLLIHLALAYKRIDKRIVWGASQI